jgi:HSP20 family molecular chaperone IbpA
MALVCRWCKGGKDMNNKFKNLISTVDLLNTLNGGVSEPYVSYRERPDGRELRIRVPGVNKEMLQVEIHDNMLNVFYHIPMETAGKKVFLPKEVIKQTLPYFVEITGIHATFEENELIVNLPYNELANGYNRRIPIGG